MVMIFEKKNAGSGIASGEVPPEATTRQGAHSQVGVPGPDIIINIGAIISCDDIRYFEANLSYLLS